MTAKHSHHRNQLYLYIFKIQNGYYKFVICLIKINVALVNIGDFFQIVKNVLLNIIIFCVYSEWAMVIRITQTQIAHQSSCSSLTVFGR